MHFYQFHIGDYKSHTHHLSPMEDLAFRRLLDHYYLHEVPIKQRDIARQIGMREFEQEVLTVLDEFFVSTEAGYINPRADKEIAKFRNHQAESSYGSFIRDHKELKPYVDKDVYISNYLDGKVREYVDTLTSRHLPLMGTSTTHDATNNQEPITNNHISICPPSGEPEVGNGLPKVCHQEVIDLYHKHLPTLRRVEVWNDTRKAYLRQRWREVAQELSAGKQIGSEAVLVWFADFFDHIGKSKFLTGRVSDKSGRAFTADLEWILRASNFAKIVEGKYHGA